MSISDSNLKDSENGIWIIFWNLRHASSVSENQKIPFLCSYLSEKHHDCREFRHRAARSTRAAWWIWVSGSTSIGITSGELGLLCECSVRCTLWLWLCRFLSIALQTMGFLTRCCRISTQWGHAFAFMGWECSQVAVISSTFSASAPLALVGAILIGCTSQPKFPH